jgi:hypothetical protein
MRTQTKRSGVSSRATPAGRPCRCGIGSWGGQRPSPRRRHPDLGSARRPFVLATLPGRMSSAISRPIKSVDLVIFRECTEGFYALQAWFDTFVREYCVIHPVTGQIAGVAGRLRGARGRAPRVSDPGRHVDRGHRAGRWADPCDPQRSGLLRVRSPAARSVPVTAGFSGLGADGAAFIGPVVDVTCLPLPEPAPPLRPGPGAWGASTDCGCSRSSGAKDDPARFSDGGSSGAASVCRRRPEAAYPSLGMGRAARTT